MSHHIAFAGFRHPHILSLWDRASAHPDSKIIAACEPDPGTRDQLHAAGKVTVTHENFDEMLRDVDFTILAIGDVYAQRGELAIAALNAGKHVILDKPICTSLRELDRIEELAREKQLSIGCQLDLVEDAAMRELQEVIKAGTLGTVCTITATAQHPLRYGTRAAWYFEPGCHGGTINDIGIHVFDLAPWLTGSGWKKTLLAREWNAKAIAAPHFKDCAQFYGILQNGASCFADVSYLAPDRAGYELPQYWRVTVHGTCGMAEASYGRQNVCVATDNDAAIREVMVSPVAPRGYFQDFLDEIAGRPSKDGITTSRVVTCARAALEAQALASNSSAA